MPTTKTEQLICADYNRCKNIVYGTISASLAASLSVGGIFFLVAKFLMSKSDLQSADKTLILSTIAGIAGGTALAVVVRPAIAFTNRQIEKSPEY